MKRITTSLAITVLLLVGAASAQYNDQKMTATIPFDFVVGKTALPAGQYVFLRTGQNQLLVRNTDGRNLTTVLTGSVETAKAASGSKLRFETVNGSHVLVQVWKEQEIIGSELYHAREGVEEAQYSAIHANNAGRR
ncbi:MAG TPA: hypothetical protein VH088_13430 [Terriglobales bacterium]|jgi:hypothetical protein|nr:hypothetical protein [Terriglobales bacterium]